MIIPDPSYYSSLKEWARDVFESQDSAARFSGRNDPMPVQLAHRVSGDDAKVGREGILLYQIDYETPVVSDTDDWIPLHVIPKLQLAYEEDHNIKGEALSAGANAIPFNSTNVNNAEWATFDPTTHYITLNKGTYYIDGFVCLNKDTGTNDKTFTGYLAETSDLTTAVGSVKMATLVIPDTADAFQNHVVSFRGQVEVASDNTTYAMIVNASTTGVSFGRAHNITGKNNIYAQLSATLVGLNEG